MKFLETFIDSHISSLVKIESLEMVTLSGDSNEGYKIFIDTKQSLYIESFDEDKERAFIRYNEIKNILNSEGIKNVD